MQEICNSNPTVVIGICDPNKSLSRNHRNTDTIFKEEECVNIIYVFGSVNNINE